MEPLNYYETATESPRIIADMMHTHHVKPKRIVTPIGDYPWPVLFAEEFSDVDILSIDNNPLQIREHRSLVTEVTGRPPKLTNIRDTRDLEKILSGNRVDLMNMSNISDYLEPEEATQLAQVLAEFDIRWVITTHMRNGLTQNGYHPEGSQSFVDTLREEGYEIYCISDNSGAYEISEYYLATMEYLVIGV